MRLSALIPMGYLMRFVAAFARCRFRGQSLSPGKFCLQHVYEMNPVVRSSKTVTVRGELAEPFILVKTGFGKIRPNGLFVDVLMKRSARGKRKSDSFWQSRVFGAAIITARYCSHES